MRVRGAVGPLVSVLIGAVCAVPAQAALPGGNGKVAFDRIVGPQTGQIYSINPDGTGEQPLASGFRPAWSPNGTRIAFERGPDIWVMNADGSNQTLLAANGSQPSWSPDGTKITFVSSRGGDDEIYVMNANGTAPAALTSNTVRDGDPDWSALDEIAFVRGPDVYLMDATGANQRFLHAGWEPNWYPEGDRLLFQHGVPGGSVIAEIRRDGTGLRDVVPSCCGGFSVRNFGRPTWAPNGGQLVWSEEDCDVRAAVCQPRALFTKKSTDGLLVKTMLAGNGAGAASWQPLPQPNYVRPKGATPILSSLVIAQRACGSSPAQSPRRHAPPLNYDSCNPAIESSDYVTAGTPDANGNPAQFAGAVRLQPVFGNPSTPQDESDMTFYAKLDDVRCRPASTACASGALSDYTGELALELRLRLTDRLVKNLPSTSEGTIDVPISCAPTADPAIGSTCSVSTTADTLIPGSAPEGTKAIWELGQLRVWDAGADGSLAVDEGDSAVFATQGIFVP